MSLLDVHGAKGRHFGRYLASFLQVEFVGCWSATESDALSGQVRGFVWWSLEAFRGPHYIFICLDLRAFQR